MAWLKKRGNLYRIKFRHAGRNESHPLKTGKEDAAQGLLFPRYSAIGIRPFLRSTRGNQAQEGCFQCQTDGGR